MEECIRDLRTWLIDGKLLLNDDETESLVIGTRQQFNKLDPLSLQVGDHNIDPSFNAGYLGAVIDNSPSMNKSVKPVYKLNLFITDTPGQGVDNLRYMYHFLSAVTQTLTLYQSAIPIPEHVFGELFRFVPKFVRTASNWEVQ